ncbi:MAG: alpha/beta hydrolase [Pseudomonadota bacterium]
MTWKKLALSGTLLSALALAGCGAGLNSVASRNETRAEQAYPPEGQFVTVEGTRLHVVVRGQGPDLVLIHGASGSARDFTFAMVDRLATRYRVFAFDRPGMGFSDRTSERFDAARNTGAESPAQQAVVMQAAAAQLGATRPIVLGHSYGGAVAMAWALERPENFSGLVIVSGATQVWESGLSPQYPVLASTLGGSTLVPILAATVSEDWARDAVDRIFSPQMAPSGYADFVGVGLALRRDTLRANARQVNTLRGHLIEMVPHYPSITQPVEILHGTADRIVGFDIHARPLAEQLPNARLTPLRGIGHMPQHVAADEVIAAIDRIAAGL